MASETSARPARGGPAESGAVMRGEGRCWLGMLATVLSGLGGVCVCGRLARIPVEVDWTHTIQMFKLKPATARFENR